MLQCGYITHYLTWGIRREGDAEQMEVTHLQPLKILKVILLDLCDLVVLQVQ